MDDKKGRPSFPKTARSGMSFSRAPARLHGCTL
jgi:hypothetical protein